MKKIFISFLLISTNLFSQTTAVFNLQGILRSPTGQAVADKSYSFVFKLYAAATAVEPLNDGTGGPWIETQSIEVKNGIYNALIGSVRAFTGIPFDRTYFVGISVDGGSELIPRIQLTAAPYALSVQGTGNKMPNDGPMTFSSNVYHKSNNINRLKFNNDGSNEINGNTVIYGNGQNLELVGTNYSYIAFYPDGRAAGRKAWLGLLSPTSNTLEIVNDVLNEDIGLVTQGSGKVNTNSNLNVGGSINVSKAEGSNVMVKVAEVSSNDFENSAITITGLDGNKHLRYKVFFEVYFDGGGGDKKFRINFNNDMGDNYRSEAFARFWGGSEDAFSYPFAIVPGRNGWEQAGIVCIEFTINAAVGNKWRSAFGNFGFSSSNPVTGDFAGYWRNTADNITSITFGTSDVNRKWGAGKISIYAIP